MDRAKVVRRTKLRLGGDVVTIEISDETINEFIDISYDHIRPFIRDTKLVTKPVAQVIDLRDEGIDEVLRVLPSDLSITVPDRIFDFEGVKIDHQTLRRSAMASYPIVDRELKFRFEKGTLYLSDRVTSSRVTIEGLFTPTVEDITDDAATRWIESYTLALSKQTCGRIRSKHRSSSIPIELDGDTLLQEAQQEIQDLDIELQERQFGPFMVMR